MKNILTATILMFTGFQASAQGLEECSKAFKQLYIDIQIYNKTEKILANEGLIQPVLQRQLDNMNADKLTTKEKVHSLESGFARCDMPLTEEEVLKIDIEAEHLLKMKNPLIID